MNALLESLSGSWITAGFAKSLMLALAGASFITCVRHRDLASRLWTGLALLLPLAFFSGLLPLSWKVLPGPAAALPAVPAMTARIDPLELEPGQLPAAPALLPEPTLDEAVAMEEATVASAALAKPVASAAPARSLKLPRKRVLAACWMAGGLLSLLPGIYSLLLARRLRAHRAPEDLLSIWREIAGGVADFVPLRLSTRIHAPGIAGLLCPVVVLPEPATDWTAERLASVLRHELHHLERRDLPCLWLARISRAMLWFHPAAWWVHSRLVIAQERAADEAVVSSGTAPADYAGHLLETAIGARCFPGLAMARRSQVGGRIRVLLERREVSSRPRRIAETAASLVCGMLALAFVVLGFAAPENAKAQEAPLLATAGPRPAILDRRGEIIATSDPAVMPDARRARGLKRWYPQGRATGHLGLVTLGKDGGLNMTSRSGLETYLAPDAKVPLRATIDLRAQRLAWNELAARELRGAIVAMDVRSGEVVAMVSWPAVDPSDLADGIGVDENEGWQNDRAQLLWNRTLALDAPGSFAKLLMALGAASNDLAGREYFCGPSVEVEGRRFLDVHPLNAQAGLPAALQKNSNAYFIQLALELDHVRVSSLADDFMLPVAHKSWGVCSVAWHPKDWVTKKWEKADLALTALGIGRNQLSLLDRAAILSAIAGGVIRQPSFVAGEQTSPPVPLSRRGVDPAELASIRQALVDSVNSGGVGAGAKLDGITVAGIPATTLRGAAGPDGGRSPRVASFAGYAPAEEPRYVVAVRLEEDEKTSTKGFYGSTMAGPVAARILQELLALEE